MTGESLGGAVSGPYGRKFPLVTSERLREILSYDPETGIFTWLVNRSNGVRAGDVAGGNCRGYIYIGIDRQSYAAHRLAFLYMTGEWPTQFADHKYGRTDDNRWSEIRQATPRVNQENRRKPKANNSTGLLGVAKNHNRFRALIRSNGRRYDLGTYATPEEAHEAYLKGKRILHEGGTL